MQKNLTHRVMNLGHFQAFLRLPKAIEPRKINVFSLHTELGHGFHSMG
jgi:hypothetical protein